MIRDLNMIRIILITVVWGQLVVASYPRQRYPMRLPRDPNRAFCESLRPNDPAANIAKEKFTLYGLSHEPYSQKLIRAVSAACRCDKLPKIPSYFHRVSKKN